jgi:hypothetical protein
MDKIAFSGNNDQPRKFLKVAINDGSCTATQVRLTLSVCYYNQFYDSFHNENITSLKHKRPRPQLLFQI